MLEKLVAALPDVYQPIFGHPELSSGVTRVCEDRLAHIKSVYQLLETKLKRPLRVLDLGCAQGFFALSLGASGAGAHGIDFLDLNIAVCHALALENPALKVTFEMKGVEEVIAEMKQGQYDLVLGLSVFHHLIHSAGLSRVEQMMNRLSQTTPVCIFEMALPNEPTKLRYDRPENPKDLLNSFTYVRELARIPTQMAVVTESSPLPTVICRPLYVASNHYQFLSN